MHSTVAKIVEINVLPVLLFHCFAVLLFHCFAQCVLSLSYYMHDKKTGRVVLVL